MNKNDINTVYEIFYNTACLSSVGISFTDALTTVIESYKKDTILPVHVQNLLSATKDSLWPQGINNVIELLVVENKNFELLKYYYSLYIETTVISTLEEGCMLYVLKCKLENSIPNNNDIEFAIQANWSGVDAHFSESLLSWSNHDSWSQIKTQPKSESVVLWNEAVENYGGGTLHILPGVQLEKILSATLDSGATLDGYMLPVVFKVSAYKNLLEKFAV